jgi:hypothetical protein
MGGPGQSRVGRHWRDGQAPQRPVGLATLTAQELRVALAVEVRLTSRPSGHADNRRYGALSAALRHSEARNFDVTLRDRTPSQVGHNPGYRRWAYASKAGMAAARDGSFWAGCGRRRRSRGALGPCQL